MRSQNNFKSKIFLKFFVLFLFFLTVFIYLLSLLKINKFEYIGDLPYIDSRVLKIYSLNLLKDQPIFWFDKNNFENQLKSELPQIKKLNYKVLNSDTLEIEIIAEDICCVITDSNEKSYVVSSEGVVLREFSGNLKTSVYFKSLNTLDKKDKISKNLVSIFKEISSENIKIEDVRDNTFFLDKETVMFYTIDSKEVIMNENTDFKKFNDNLKSMKSFLEQNQRKYTVLDFRFEKIIVK